MMEDVAEDLEDMAGDIRNATRLLNECVRNYLGFPVFAEWWNWGLDILYDRVPANSEFFRPSNLWQWLQPQYIMMLVSWVACHIFSWSDARIGSRLCKWFDIKQGAFTKVCHFRISGEPKSR